MGRLDKAKEALKSVTAEINPNYKRTWEVRDQIHFLKDHPESDDGHKLRWANVDLVLKPEIYLLTGIPSSGKSTWLDNVIINSIIMHEYKWGIFSPESHPVALHMTQLIGIKSMTNLHGKFGATETMKQDIDRELKRLEEHVIMLTPDEDNVNIESMLSLFDFMVEEHKCNAFVLDPYNEFSHTRPTGMSETEYVSRFLGRVRAFINRWGDKDISVMVWIVAHPTKLRKEDCIAEDGTECLDYPIPTAYDIAGSANFFNKPDNIIAVHRDRNKFTNPMNISTVAVQKVRRRSTGTLGLYKLKFDFKTATYTSYSGELL